MSEFSEQLDEFVEGVERPDQFTPVVHYDEDGDCIEFIAEPDSFYAERIDELVTAYRSYRSKKVVGFLIKGVRRLREEILRRIPGFKIEIRDGKVRLEHLLLARLWTSDLTG